MLPSLFRHKKLKLLPSHRRNNYLAWIACAFFMLAGLAFIPHLGIEGDEALFASGIYPPRGELYAFRIGRSHIPLMLMNYVGALKSWIYSPILNTLGAGPATLRVPIL